MLDGSLPAMPQPVFRDEAWLDELYDGLSHHRRRAVLRELHEAGESLSLEELAARVVRHERERPDDWFPDDDRETVRFTLFHTHVPKLAESNVVEYDPSSGTVEYRTPTGEG